jgi:hypothetical protein
MKAARLKRLTARSARSAIYAVMLWASISNLAMGIATSVLGVDAAAANATYSLDAVSNDTSADNAHRRTYAFAANVSDDNAHLMGLNASTQAHSMAGASDAGPRRSASASGSASAVSQDQINIEFSFLSILPFAAMCESRRVQRTCNPNPGPVMITTANVIAFTGALMHACNVAALPFLLPIH